MGSFHRIVLFLQSFTYCPDMEDSSEDEDVLEDTWCTCLSSHEVRTLVFNF